MLFDPVAVGRGPKEGLQFLSEILQSSGYSIITEALDGRILLWNEGARRLYGYEAEEVLGKANSAILYPSEEISAGRPVATLKAALLSGKWSGTTAQIRKNGGRFHARTAITPCFDAAGRHTGYLHISEDHSKGADAQADERFGGLLESAPDAMLVVNSESRIVAVNSRTEKLFGYSREELIGKSIECLVPVGFQAAHPAEYTADAQVRAMGTGRELYGLRRDGGEVPVEISLGPFEAEGQHFVIGAVRDVTHRRNIEAKFRGLLESAPDAMVISNHEGLIVLANSQAEKLFLYTRAEMLGQPVEMLVPERFRHSHASLSTGYFRKPRVRPIASGLDLFGLRKDGSEFPAEIGLSPLDTEDGMLVSSSIRDNTERKNFERTLREKNLELENANLAKDRFLATMSHELRTPLNAIIGFTGTLLMKLPGPLLPQQEKHLRTVQSSGRHLLSLINDLLDLAKIESGKVEIMLEPVGCGAVVEEVVATLRPAAKIKDLTFTAAVDPPNLAVRADRRALSQILLNLTTNAIKFTQRGIVAIKVERRREANGMVVAISVSDTGVGIQEADQAKLFQPFERVGPTVRGTEGTGLGLHLSRKLAELLGGTISLRSVRGEGSTFTLLLEEA